MSSIAFNSGLSSAGAVTGTGQTAQRNNIAAAGTNFQSDTVSLSPTAQATALQQQGFTINEIASFMGLTAATIDGYLDITTASNSGGGGGGGVPAGGPTGGGGHAGAPQAAAGGTAAGSTTAANGTAASNKSAAPAAENTTAKATPVQQ